MNFAAQPAKSCCFSTVLLLLDWLQDIVHRRYDRISRILKRGVDVVEVFPQSQAADSQRYGSEKSLRRWHIASVRYDAEFDRCRGIADMAGPKPLHMP
jgi:predicted nuclease with RNAse H fold